MKKTDVMRRTKGKIALGTLVATLVLGTASGAMADSNGKKVRGWQPATQALRTDQTQVPGGCPIESPAGAFLFTARNPGTGIDIYANQLSADGETFEPGSALPAPVNDVALANDFCPTPLPDGYLYFVSNRSGGCGSADMQLAVNHPATGWTEPQNLGCEPNGPNTPGLELSPAVITTIWGTFLFFSTDYHTGNQDIYMSRMRADGTFEPGRRLGYPIKYRVRRSAAERQPERQGNRFCL